MRRAISVIKKRTGAHEDTIREYRIDGRGITLGEPLRASRAFFAACRNWSSERPALLEAAAE